MRSADIEIKYILKAIKAFSGYEKEVLLGNYHRPEIVDYMHIARFLTRKRTNLSYTQIGKRFNRTHTVIINSCTTVSERIGEKLQACLDYSFLQKHKAIEALTEQLLNDIEPVQLKINLLQEKISDFLCEKGCYPDIIIVHSDFLGDLFSEITEFQGIELITSVDIEEDEVRTY